MQNQLKQQYKYLIMAKKKLNKFVVSREYNQSAIFAKGGNLYSGLEDMSSYLSAPGMMRGQSVVSGGPDMSKILAGAPAKFASANQGAGATTGLNMPGVSGYLGAAQGIMQLGSQAINNLSADGIGNEVVGTSDMSRGDILNTNVNVDSRQTNTGGQALSGAMTGAQAGMALGPLGAGIGAGVGLLAGGISSIIGNNKKQKAADLAEQQWTNNLEAKNRQFQGQDLRTSMANFSAMGGDLFAYGGQMPSQLTSFESGGSHQSNPNGGILQGTGANGQPNLVEEGETKHEDYIFSDRLKINPQILKDFKLPKGLNGKTFADASKYLNREAKDRPNDPISKNGVKSHLAKLTAAQEGLKAQQQPPQGIPMDGQPNANILAQGYANGGFIDQTHYQNLTLQGANIGAMGGSVYDGESESSSQMGFAQYGQRFSEVDPQNAPQYTLPNLMNPTTTINSIVNPSIELDSRSQYAGSQYQKNKIMNKVAQDNWNNSMLSGDKSNSTASNRTSDNGKTDNSTDYSRYAPVAANIAMGISDMFEKPEVVKYGRVNPERITARMDYQPIDIEWMNNKMNATYAGTRDQMINQAGGNRAMAMAGLSGINQQQQNAVGEAYLKAQDINYNRKNQATQFNAGVEAQNLAAQNAAQQTNIQLQMQEMNANANNRAAKRNAARNAILNAATNIGQIGKENFDAKTGQQMFGYGQDPNGIITYGGNKYKKV